VAADKYSLTLNAHRQNPRDIDAIRAWDEADTELSRVISHDETNIIIVLLAELEAKTKHIADMEHVVAAAKCDDELWDAMAHRLKTLEDRLATPVIRSADSDPQRDHFGCSVRTTDSGTFYITRLGSVPGREMALYRNEAEALFLGLREALSAGFTVEGNEQ
jgi:hypothetical protein